MLNWLKSNIIETTWFQHRFTIEESAPLRNLVRWACSLHFALSAFSFIDQSKTSFHVNLFFLLKPSFFLFFFWFNSLFEQNVNFKCIHKNEIQNDQHCIILKLFWKLFFYTFQLPWYTWILIIIKLNYKFEHMSKKIGSN